MIRLRWGGDEEEESQDLEETQVGSPEEEHLDETKEKSDPDETEAGTNPDEAEVETRDPDETEDEAEVEERRGRPQLWTS